MDHPHRHSNNIIWSWIGVFVNVIILMGCQPTPRTGYFPVINSNAQDLQKRNTYSANTDAKPGIPRHTAKKAAIGSAGKKGLEAVGKGDRRQCGEGCRYWI